MDNLFTLASKTGDIVIQCPRTSSLFKKYQIDFCCGGDRPIGEALDETEYDKETILNEINHLYLSVSNQDNQINWTDKSNQELVNQIVTVHHDYLRQVLPELQAYVTKVERVHGRNHPELKSVYTVFQHLKEELEAHISEEEDTLFPTILEDNQGDREIIHQFEHEHGYAGKLLKSLRESTNNYQAPEGACKTFQLTYLKLDELESDLFQHIHLENNILFPRFKDNKVS